MAAKGSGSATTTAVVLIFILSSSLVPSTSYTIYKVGDDAGWTNQAGSPIDYNAWAATKSFLVGDMLVFGYQGSHTVVQTNNPDTYDSCNADAPDAILLSSSSGEANVILRSEGKTYFFCSALAGEHCREGMKLAVNVGPSKTGGAMSPNEAPSPFSPAAPSADSTAAPLSATPLPPVTTTGGSSATRNNTKSDATQATRLGITVFPWMGLLLFL